MKLLVDYMNGPIHVETTLNADVVPRVEERISLDMKNVFSSLNQSYTSLQSIQNEKTLSKQN